MNAVNTAFVLMSAALVMLMTPGLALFYGGMVRGKNVLATLMQNLVLLAVIGIQWALFGYSLAFGPDVGGLIGNLSWAGLNGVGVEPYSLFRQKALGHALAHADEHHHAQHADGAALQAEKMQDSARQGR